MSKDTAKPAARYEHPRCATCHRRDHFPGTWQGHPYEAPAAVVIGAAHDLTVTLDGTGFLVTCAEGCNLGSSAHAPTQVKAQRRVDLHRLATTPLGPPADDADHIEWLAKMEG